MNLLLAGGSGLVGTAVTPYLQHHHNLRVLDLVPPQRDDVEYLQGSIADPDAVRGALDGMDAFVTMAMKGGQGGHDRHHTMDQVLDNYTVNCLGHHVLLYTAAEMGVMRGIYTGTMSVHNRHRTWYPSEEEVPLDGPNVYGLTKGLTEQICHYFAREYHMSLLVYRITGPCNRAMFIDRIKNPPGGPKLYYTDEEDMAEAYLAGLRFLEKAGGGQGGNVQVGGGKAGSGKAGSDQVGSDQAGSDQVGSGKPGSGRCEVFFISGDEQSEEMNMAKARELLGWEPMARKKLGI